MVLREQIKTPSQKIVQSWNRTQTNLVTTTARESGLYYLCFRKLGGSSGTITVSYSFDFISTGALSSSAVLLQRLIPSESFAHCD